MYESDEFVKAYASEKDDHPFRVAMERYSVVHWLGDVQGKRVLDAGCGAGNYSRLLCELGASQVVGIDSALKMIHCAETMTTSDYPIDYAHHAAEAYISSQPFDLVFHSCLLNYATSGSHLPVDGSCTIPVQDDRGWNNSDLCHCVQGLYTIHPAGIAISVHI